MAEHANAGGSARRAGAVAVLAAGGFAAVAVAVQAGWAGPIDAALLERAGRHDARGLARGAASVTELGAWIVVVTMATLCSGLLWIRGERWAVALLAVGLAGGTAINHALKAAFARARPDVFEWRILYAGEHAFPSGHALQAAVAYTLFAWTLGRLSDAGAFRAGTWAVATLVILVVGATRIYLGVHFPSDVVGGILVGTAWAAACIAGSLALGGRSGIPTPGARGEG